MADAEPSSSQDLTLPEEGQVIAGKYRIEKVLGRGGMGVVVSAEHTALRQRVAVKFLLPEAVARAGSVERFLREARAAVMIQSEHVARVFDVGTLDTGSPYMVMELLSGADLGDVLAKEGPLPPAVAVDYVLQACEAIAEAHSTGIIHRDLKPANLYLTSRADGSPLVKVLDFGLSKPPKTDALDASLTQANAIMGSPFYMSPEQIRGLKGLDNRADIWSLGVILYQLLTGVRPFEAESLGALFLMIGADAPPPLRTHRPDLPEDLEAAVLRCLEKDLARRTASVGDLARDLAPFGSELAAVSVDRILRMVPASGPRPPMSSDLGKSGDLAKPPAESSGEVAAAPVVAGEASVKSGSIQAVTNAPSEASSPPTTRAPAKKSAVPFVGLAAAIVIGLGVASMALRKKPPEQAAQPPPASAAPAASTALVPAAPASATVAPAITPSADPPASASAPAAASAPVASASAAASASAKPKTPTKTPTKKKDLLDRWQ